MLDTNDLQLIKQTFNDVFVDLKLSIQKIYESIEKLGNSDHTIEMALQNEINERKSCHAEHGSEANIIHSKIRETNKEIDELKKKIEEIIARKNSLPTRIYENISKTGKMILMLIAVFGAITGGLLALTTWLLQIGIIKK